MKVSREQVIHIAELAHLKLTEEEIEVFQNEMNQILEYMEMLNELNTTYVESLSHPIEVKNVFREDKVDESISREEALKNAPDSTEEYFKVPKVI